MYTILSATNRKNSQTLKVAKYYASVLEEKNIPHKFFSLENLPEGFLHTGMYDKKNEDWKQLMQELFYPTEKFFIIMPEYNGSMPGILKLFIDASDIKQVFWNKKACLTGVSAGRAGNLRGMEHLTGSLLHIKMQVFHNRLPLSSIDDEINAEDHLFRETTTKVINTQIEGFLNF